MMYANKIIPSTASDQTESPISMYRPNDIEPPTYIYLFDIIDVIAFFFNYLLLNSVTSTMSIELARRWL